MCCSETANIIKVISRQSTQAVAVAIKTVLKGERKRNFQEMLNEVADALSALPEKKEKTDKPYGIPSDEKVFEDDICPQIKSGITTYLDKLNRSIDLQWNVDFGFIDTIHEGKMDNIEIIKFTQDEILAAEQTLTNILLLTAYARGIAYLAARPFVTGNIKEW